MGCHETQSPPAQPNRFARGPSTPLHLTPDRAGQNNRPRREYVMPPSNGKVFMKFVIPFSVAIKTVTVPNAPIELVEPNGCAPGFSPIRHGRSDTAILEIALILSIL